MIPSHLNKKFFDKNGISSSQANFVADQIKERNRLVASEIENTRPYTERLTVDSVVHTVARSEKKNLFELSQKEGRLYALSAWLREAMKAKQDFQKYYISTPDTELVEFPVEKLTMPLRPVIPVPVAFTEKEAIATFSIADLAAFYTAESLAAHIGKRIHGTGVVAKLRSDTLERREQQTEFRVLNNVSCPVTFSPTYYVDEIDGDFQKLHEIHRGFERMLNNFKARIHNLMNDTNVARHNEYKKQLADANAKYMAEFNEYSRQLSALDELRKQASASAAILRDEKLKEISAWKIAIPKEMESVFDEIVAVTHLTD